MLSKPRIMKYLDPEGRRVEAALGLGGILYGSALLPEELKRIM